MIGRKCVASALLSLGVTIAHADEPRDFASRQPLETAGDKAFYRIELPDSVYDAVTRADLGDLRVFNADNFHPFMPYGFGKHGPSGSEVGVMAAAAIIFFAF